MAKEEVPAFEGVITEVLSEAQFHVRLGNAPVIANDGARRPRLFARRS